MLVLVLALSVFAGCGPKENPNAVEIAFVTDIGTIDDQSFNQGSYEGVEAWGKANGKTYGYYQPADSDKTNLINTIELAITNGAKVVTCSGFVFDEAIKEVAPAHPDVKFVICDTQVPSMPNVATFTYLAEEAGYMAGYASVMDGHYDLAYIGGVGFPTVYGAGQGFIKGADDAAKEKDITIKMAYGFTGNFVDNPENKAMMAAVFASGTEVIFSFGGGNTASAFAAASEITPNRWVITPDTDGTGTHATAYSSVMKELGKTMGLALDDIYNNDFAKFGGKHTVLSSKEGMVGLPAGSKFEQFSDADYEALMKKVQGMTVVVSDEAEANNSHVDVLGLTNTEFRYV